MTRLSLAARTPAAFLAVLGTLALATAALASGPYSATLQAPIEKVPFGSPLEYTFEFTNLASATLPVQNLVATFALDQDLDVSTFAFDAVTIGSRTIVPPPGVQAYATTVDLRPGLDVIVSVVLQLDPPTGVASWSLSSLDPETGQEPRDPSQGFLPPNVSPPEGEGSILFSVQASAGLCNDTVIENAGSFFFDSEGVPLETSYSSVGTVPDLAPSPVQGLESTVCTLNSQLLSWIAPADDDGCIAASYEIRHSSTSPVGLSAENWWNTATVYPSAPVPASPGTQQSETVDGLPTCQWHYFAIRSYDGAGNPSGVSNILKAKTKCTPSGTCASGFEETPSQLGGVAGSTLRLAPPKPNPAGASVALEYEIPLDLAGTTLSIGVYDITGRVVRRIEPSIARSGQFAWSWDLRDDSGQRVGPGMYWARLQVGGSRLVRPLIVR